VNEKNLPTYASVEGGEGIRSAGEKEEVGRTEALRRMELPQGRVVGSSVVEESYLRDGTGKEKGGFREKIGKWFIST